MFGIIVISHMVAPIPPVTSVSSEECISRVLSSPDMKCPICGKHLEVWVNGDVPLFRCSICGGLGFKLDKGKIEQLISRATKANEPGVICPGCGSELIRTSIGRLKLDSCAGCDWVFVEEGNELPAEDVQEGDRCSQYLATLRALGNRYEFILSRL